MKKTIICILLLCSIMSLSARKKDKKKTQEVVIDLSNVGPVFIDFKYDNIVIETRMLENGKKEVVTKDYGQSDFKLFFMNHIKADLIKRKLNIVEEDQDHKYSILIHYIPTAQISVTYAFVEVEIYSQNKKLSREVFRGSISEMRYLNEFTVEINNYISSILK